MGFYPAVMVNVEEIRAGRTELAAAALAQLRPRWANMGTLVEMIETRLRPAGYRLVGVFDDGQADALAVAGFRECHGLAWGHYLYVDDLSTLAGHRGAGHGDRLMAWLESEADRLACEAVHLDSGVGADRAAAHRLYMRHHLRISAYHFEKDLDEQS
jgi:GNAT superfamily N-acetyltransferase